MKRYITGVLCFLLPSIVLRPLLRLLGHKVGKGVKIGFSLLCVNEFKASEHSIIGHLNLVLNESVLLDKKSKIGYLNILKGPFKLHLKEDAAIGNKNYFTRAKKGVTYGNSIMKLGILTKVTTGHHLDLTRSIIFGNYSILAGIRSQMWTHGYYHDKKGAGRIRIDGEISIGNNVYVGSGCIFNPGVKVSDAIHIGAGSVISKNLEESGMYVNQGLRHISNNIERIKIKLNKIKDIELVEEVFTKL